MSSVYRKTLRAVRDLNRKNKFSYGIDSRLKEAERELKRRKKDFLKHERLFEIFCGRIKSADFNEKDITEILIKYGADYSAVFSAELLLRCAAALCPFSEIEAKIQIIGGCDFLSFFRLCREEKALESFDDFAVSDSETKMMYRRAALENSEEIGLSCYEYLVSLNCEYAGEKLFGKKQNGRLLLAFEIAVPLILTAAVSFYTRSVFSGVLLYLPIWQITSSFSVRASEVLHSPAFLPRADKKFLTDENSRTVIAVSLLLTESFKEEEKHIEQLYFSNCGENISLCILADLLPSENEESENDGAVISAVKTFAERINKKCGGAVCVCVRPRVYSKTQREFSGRERKRGAIEDLMLCLAGEKQPFSYVFGAELPKDVKYVFALDSDTLPSTDCAEELICTAVHPMNREKYGIFAPRAETNPVAPNTLFSRLVSGSGGITPYHSRFAERYQDDFGKSIFSGKGLINAEEFREKCCRRFKDETVLSHDILEGELLCTAYVSDCEVLERFPKNQSAYLKRLHRWVRGDWQNCVFIFSKHPFKNRSEENPFSFLSRFKLFDNLRRSITMLFSLLCIILSAFSVKHRMLFFIVGLLSAVSAELAAFLFSRRLFPLARGLLSLALLPAEALASADGAIKGLYRRLVSKKNMLSWTTARQGEQKTEPYFCAASLFPALLLLIFGFPASKAVGVIFFLGILFSFFSGRKYKKRKEPDGERRKILISDCERMWNYYIDFANRENSFLPPDNVSFLYSSSAARTSPTNIGLMLLSSLAAYDLKLIGFDGLCRFLENSLLSVEELQKFRGNLYNWYDTKTGGIIKPYFVSSVDSGNFVCSLSCLKNGLEEIGGERARNLAKRIEKIIDETDLRVLYDSKKELFHIGYDDEKGKMTAEHYDLLMSEARTLSYYAVSSRIVPKSHWEALSRELSAYGRFFGPLSWSGTAFEYFMPNIFLPAYENTAEYAALRFAEKLQKKFAEKRGIPFGISESCCNDSDGGGYLYRANGIKELSLKNEKTEPVVSPYSSYLMLPLSPKDCFENLERLKALGAYGKYGFYEAVDFKNGNSQGEIVKSYMAHHIGMSILSADNALNGNIMQRRFMRDKLSAEVLLREKIPGRPFYSCRKRRKRRLS